MANKYFKAFQTLKGTGKKIKGVQETDSAIREGIAKGLREHRKSESYKGYRRIMKKLKKNPDLSYLKGTLND